MTELDDTEGNTLKSGHLAPATEIDDTDGHNMKVHGIRPADGPDDNAACVKH